MKKRKRYDPNSIQDLPDLIELEDHEKFKGENDEPLEIEVRGERTRKSIFFKASDIGNAFEYPTIGIVIRDKKGDYEYGKHYKYFNAQRNSLSQELYLTYLGVLKVLMCSRGNKAEIFPRLGCRYSVRRPDGQSKR
tara:strand:+ start:788 stop:1195 length:408 start_codon:yes stop_codon:yes gene_type:complete